MPRKRKGRLLNAVLLLDKPSGASSNDILQKVRRIYGAAKAGHTGALDPLATGMLPICFGEATKFSQFLLDADKTYRVVAKLGERTDTSDADGGVIATNPVNFSQQLLLNSIENFRGKTQQVPSIFSALKHQGKPLYWYARQGIKVDIPARDIEVFDIQLLSQSSNHLELEVHCSKGTYIRTIIDDLGQLLGCGAHVAQLHRTKVAHFPVGQMVSLDKLRDLSEQQKVTNSYEDLDALLMPMDATVVQLPVVKIQADDANYFQSGNPVVIADLIAAQFYRVYCNDKFLGIGALNDQGALGPKRLVNYYES